MGTEINLTRRGLLGAGAGVAAAAALGTRATGAFGTSSAGASTDLNFGGATILPPARIGIQLYTVRDSIQSMGFAPVLEAIADVGYTVVEFAGYTQGTGPITTAQIRQLLDANGLVGLATHVSPSNQNMSQLLDDAQILGLSYLGISLVVPPNTTVSGWQQLAAQFNGFGTAAAARGIKFYFHNHFEEWAPTTDQPATRGIDVLLAETDPTLVFWEFDIYWAYVGQHLFGGAPFPLDPLAYAVANRSRIPLFHVKDGRRNTASPLGYDITDVGQGSLDFESFFCAFGEPNLHWYLNERDNASEHAQGPLASAKCSYVHMRHGLVGCGGSPTAVAAVGFAARPAGGHVALIWRTPTEADVLGFNVWRRGVGRTERVNASLVRARHAGQAHGGSYRLVDRTARHGVTYTYRLEVVGPAGTRVNAGSVEARAK